MILQFKKNSKLKAVLRIRDILVRIRIPGSGSLDPDPRIREAQKHMDPAGSRYPTLVKAFSSKLMFRPNQIQYFTYNFEKVPYGVHQNSFGRLIYKVLKLFTP
jgi:hypothetical protein